MILHLGRKLSLSHDLLSSKDCGFSSLEMDRYGFDLT